MGEVVEELSCELHGPDGDLPIDQSMSRYGTRLVGRAEGLAAALSAIVPMPASVVLAAFGLADEAYCATCGRAAWRDPDCDDSGDDDQHDDECDDTGECDDSGDDDGAVRWIDGWHHGSFEPQADHCALVVDGMADGFTSDVCVRRVRRALGRWLSRDGERLD